MNSSTSSSETSLSAESAIRFSQRGYASADQPISVLMAQALAQPDLISLAAGFVDQTRRNFQ